MVYIPIKYRIFGNNINDEFFYCEQNDRTTKSQDEIL
jgi:hypothetical protein